MKSQEAHDASPHLPVNSCSLYTTSSRKPSLTPQQTTPTRLPVCLIFPSTLAEAYNPLTLGQALFHSQGRTFGCSPWAVSLGKDSSHEVEVLSL